MGYPYLTGLHYKGGYMGYPYLIGLHYKGFLMGYPDPYFCLCAFWGPEEREGWGLQGFQRRQNSFIKEYSRSQKVGTSISSCP